MSDDNEQRAAIETLPYEDIRLAVDDGGVALIELHRPDVMNTLSGTMARELSDAYTRCDEDDRVRVIVLTGAGRAFCAGADMSAGEATFERQDGADFSSSPVSPTAFELRKPVIAAMNGHAIGIGLTLALQCDIRLAAREAKYGVVQVRRGVMPDGHSLWTLPRLIGIAKAAEILLTGRTMKGDELASLGAASQALPSVEVLPAALDMARELAVQAAPLSLAVTKRLLWESVELSPSQLEYRETQLHHVLMGRPDAVEGVMAFMERRDPKWSSSVSRDWPEWPEIPIESHPPHDDDPE